MAEMVEEHMQEVYIKDVRFYRTYVTAASEEDARVKTQREHTTLEGYEHLDSSLRFYTGDFIHRTTNENDDEPEEILDQLQADYAELEKENARLKKELSKLKGEPEDESGSEAEPEVKVESEAEEEQPCYEVFVEKWEDYDDLENDAWEEVDEFTREFPLDDLEGATSYYHEVVAQKKHYRHWKHITLRKVDGDGNGDILNEEAWERGET